MKFSQKISRFSTITVLAGYITVLILNAAHIHVIDFGKSEESINLTSPQTINHFTINGSEITCNIHFAYSSINASADFGNKTYVLNNFKPDFYFDSSTSSKPNKILLSHYFLRAPPLSFFS